MAEVRIAAETRTEFGKGAARRIRRDHKVPAVVYGHGTDPLHVTLPGHELMLALKHSNVLLELDLPDGLQLVLPKSVQRDPVKMTLEHVDLVLVRRGETVEVEVPVNVEGAPIRGGVLDLQLTTLTVSASATAIPSSISVDVEGTDIGYQLTAGQVVLPEGTTLLGDPDQLVLHVLGQQADPNAAIAEAAPAAESTPIS
jgi:large subunit ribosomal protein L25